MQSQEFVSVPLFSNLIGTWQNWPRSGDALLAPVPRSPAAQVGFDTTVNSRSVMRTGVPIVPVLSPGVGIVGVPDDGIALPISSSAALMLAMMPAIVPAQQSRSSTSAAMPRPIQRPLFELFVGGTGGTVPGMPGYGCPDGTPPGYGAPPGYGEPPGYGAPLGYGGPDGGTGGTGGTGG